MASYSNEWIKEMKNQAKDIIKDRIDNTKHILKPMPPPTPSPTSTQSAEDELLFSQMSQEELDTDT